MNSNFTNPSHSSLQVQQAEEGGQSSVDQTVAVRHGEWSVVLPENGEYMEMW